MFSTFINKLTSLFISQSSDNININSQNWFNALNQKINQVDTYFKKTSKQKQNLSNLMSELEKIILVEHTLV